MLGLTTGDWYLDSVLACLFLILASYSWYKRKVGYFARRGIPHVPAGSIVRNNFVGIFLPDGTTTGDVYDAMYKRLKAEGGHRGYGGFYHLLSPAYILTSAEMVVKTTVTDFNYFNDHGVFNEHNPIDCHLFALSGSKWRSVRKKLSPAFTSGKLKGMFDLVVEHADKLKQILDGYASTGTEVEVRELLTRFTTDVIGSCAFGLNSGTMNNPDSQLRKMGESFFVPPLNVVLKTGLWLLAPRLVNALKMRTSDKRVDEFFLSTVRQTMDFRTKTGTQRNDLLQLLMQLKETGSIECENDDLRKISEDLGASEDSEHLKIDFTDELLTAQALVFFLGGFETTASAMSYTLYFMGKHPDVQDKARREVMDVLAKHDGQMTYDALKEMDYLNACFNEALRLYPPLHLVIRKCLNDYRLEDGNVIEKGQWLILPVFSLHRDPDYFEDPLEFRPERFMPGSPPPKPGSFVPFGFGPRLCIAQRFAYMGSKLCLAGMLRRYRFELGPSMSEPLKLSMISFLARPKDGIKLVMKPLGEN